MLYTFEMANNHMGSVSHAKKIIDEFAELARRYDLTAAIKLQFRQLKTFIHKDYHESDLKYVKRFKETELTKEQFVEIVNHIRVSSMKTMATPFDNESLEWLSTLDIDIIKIASCSIDDWPLLEEVSKINKKIIISTAGAHFDVLKKVYGLFKRNKRQFAFMHCVGEYPTPPENANLNRIKLLQQAFPDIEIGFSTHESPLVESVTPYAVAMGCTIIEKHVGLPTENVTLNAYSCTSGYMENLIKTLGALEVVTNTNTPYYERIGELETLKKLKRGAYARRGLEAGHILEPNDIYYAMPVKDGQLDASNFHDMVGGILCNDVSRDEEILREDIASHEKEALIEEIKTKVKQLLNQANITITPMDKAQLSAHYGLEKFYQVGCAIVDKINREYCKKIIVVLPGQSHPAHHHIKKEETFELLTGDCTLNMNGTDVELRQGVPKIIFRKVQHSFKSNNGCVVEEISTTHLLNDSKYEDLSINKLDLAERKIKVDLV